MNHGDVLVIGGTSDARAICQQLDAADVRYTLSVATPTGERLAGDIRGQIRCGRMEWQQMAEWLRAQRTRWVILGGMGAKNGRKTFNRNVSASGEEVECFKRIVEGGVEIFYQLVPNDKAVNIRSLF